MIFLSIARTRKYRFRTLYPLYVGAVHFCLKKLVKVLMHLNWKPHFFLKIAKIHEIHNIIEPHIKNLDSTLASKPSISMEERKISKNPIITIVKSRKFHVFLK